MITTWWKISRYRNDIERVLVAKETPKYVTIQSSSQFGKGTYRESKADIFPSFREARIAKLDSIKERLNSLTTARDREWSDWNQVFMMDEPK